MIVNIAKTGTTPGEVRSADLMLRTHEVKAVNAQSLLPSNQTEQGACPFRLILWSTKEEKLEVVTNCYHLRV